MDARWHNGSHRIVWLTVTHPKKSSRIQWESRELPSSPANQSAMYYTHKIHCIHRSKVNIWVHILVSFYFFFSFRCSFLISNFIDFSFATTIFVNKKVDCRLLPSLMIFSYNFFLSFLALVFVRIFCSLWRRLISFFADKWFLLLNFFHCSANAACVLYTVCLRSTGLTKRDIY